MSDVDVDLLKSISEFDWDRASLLKRVQLAERLLTRITENPEFYVDQIVHIYARPDEAARELARASEDNHVMNHSPNTVSWSTRCKSDPRFDAQGEASGFSDAQARMDAWILGRAKELGVEPPDDIEISGWKK